MAECDNLVATRMLLSHAQNLDYLLHWQFYNELFQIIYGSFACLVSQSIFF
jgi:hypothetical protein